MPDRPDLLPESPKARPAPSDLVGEALRALRIAGTLLLREVHRPPFRLAVPAAVELEAMMKIPAGSRAAAFHLAERGRFTLRRESEETLCLETGEVVLVLSGEPHLLEHGEAERVVGFAELLTASAHPPRVATSVGEGDSIRMTCGALVFRDARLNPLFDALPDVLRVGFRPGGSDGPIDPLISLLLAELERDGPATRYIVERLFEVLCAAGIRRHVAEHADSVGWFRGVTDVAVGRALRAFHAAPGEGWSVDRLARAAHLSPSRFATRFIEAIGVPAMTYVTRWRINTAMRALSASDRTVSELAFESGYESVPAFSRAFKRLVGSSPTAYRTAARTRR